MKQFAVILVAISSHAAIAQTRVRPIGAFRADSKGVSLVVSFEARSTGVLVLDASEKIDEASFSSSAHCNIDADVVAKWADSTATLVNNQISRPEAPEKIEYEGPELPSDECVIRVDRTVYATGSKYSLAILSRALIVHASAVATVTQAQAVAFIGKIRGAATVTLAMSPATAAPNVPSNPTMTAVTAPTTSDGSSAISTGAVPFPYPGYLENIVRQIALRFQTSSRGPFHTEVFFIINRDGSVSPSSIRIVTRSGNYSFDADAEGAVEAAANARAFGPLPAGYTEESLPITFWKQSIVTATHANYPPSPTEFFLPPLPVPDKVRGFHFSAVFDVDETGRVISFTFTPTPDSDYNKKIDDMLHKMRFRPASTPDGLPVRAKAQLIYEF